MINPFTIQSKIDRIQEEVLAPLYTVAGGQANADHNWLLAETGRAISKHQRFIHEVCGSRLVAAAFKVVKILGGADQLTQEDFDRFTSYVNEGGISAMLKMLLSVEKEKVFVAEIQGLPLQVQQNAAKMLAKSNILHTDFVTHFLKQTFGSLENSPEQLRANLTASTDFITRLTVLAEKYS